MSQMHLAGFLIAGGTAHSHALWQQNDLNFLHPELYQNNRLLQRLN